MDKPSVVIWNDARESLVIGMPRMMFRLKERKPQAFVERIVFVADSSDHLAVLA